MRASDRPMRGAHGPLRLLALVLAAACVLPAQAQEGNSRDREALRRAQAALNDTRRELAALQAERSALQRDKEAAAAQAQAAQQGRDGLQAQLRSLQQQLDRLREAQQAEHQRQQAEQEAAATQAAERQRQASGQLADLQAQLADTRRANASVSALLERATRALAEAQDKNRQLHALALQAVERYRAKSPTEAALQGDPLLGLTQVRIENVAEDLRTQADALRLPAAR